MNCKCLDDLSKKVEEQGYEGASFENMLLSFSDMKWRLGIPFKFKIKKKDGTYQKKKGIKNIVAPFCPFCGIPTGLEKIEEVKDDK